MKVKTEELKGKALNWAVAQIEYPDKEMGRHAHSDQLVVPHLDEPHCYYSVSAKWNLAGPIIEREMIDLFHQDNGYHGAIEMCTDRNVHPTPFFATTVLVAAMRCYVNKKTGCWVDIPEDMMP